MSASAAYEQTIAQVHAAIRDLADKVARAALPQAILDAYLAAARGRADWTEVI